MTYHPHQSRDRIVQILMAAQRPMTPKQVFDAAQAAGVNMTYVGIRKLMRAMLRGYLHQGAEGSYSLLDSLSQIEINGAPQEALFAELRTSIDRHRAQRHTQPKDVIAVEHKLLKQDEAAFRNVPVKAVQINIVIAKPTN